MIISGFQTKRNEKIEISEITVLIGPNNSGKSQTLTDLHSLCRGKKHLTILLDALNSRIDLPTAMSILSPTTESNGNLRFRSLSSDLRQFSERYVTPKLQPDHFFQELGEFFVAHLPPDSRLNVINRDTSTLELHQAQSLMGQIWLSRKTTAKKIEDAFTTIFKRGLIFDHSLSGTRVFRIPDETEISEERRCNEHLMAKYPILDGQGHGYRSLVALLACLVLSKDRLVLIDEPEAFLHPAQAYSLGKWISDHRKEIRGQVIFATHSPSFLRGILEGNSQVTLIRLNRTINQLKYSSLTTDSVQALMRNPLLSSQRIYESIFFKGVVVVEADADRAVYQTISSQLDQSSEILFTHAHNKQTIAKAIPVVRELDIPYACIVDLDIINSEEDLEKLWHASTQDDFSPVRELLSMIRKRVGAQEPDTLLSTAKESVKELENIQDFETFKREYKKVSRSWSNKLSKLIKERDLLKLSELTTLIQTLSQKGIFVVPLGELEDWFEITSNDGPIKKKHLWITQALELIHNKRNSKELKPLISFVKDIIHYLSPEVEL